VTRTRSQFVAERLAHTCDHADVADPVAEHETFGRFHVIGVAGLEREHRASMRSMISCAGTTFSFAPLSCASSGMNSMKRTPTAFSRPNRARSTTSSSLITAHDHRVDLDRRESGEQRGVDTGEHTIELVAFGQREEPFALQ